MIFRRNDGFQDASEGGIVSWLTLPFRLVFAFIVFMIQAWTTSRSGFGFALGLPAVLACGLYFAGLLLADLRVTDGRKLKQSEDLFNYHLQNSPDNPEYAEMFAQKLTELKPENPEYLFNLGQAWVRTKGVEAATDLMSHLAPEDRAGFTKAHIWMVRMLGTQQGIERFDDETRQEMMIRHLNFALETSPDDTQANIMLGRLYRVQASKFERGSEEFLSNLRQADLYLTRGERSNGGRLTSADQITIIPLQYSIRKELGEQEQAEEKLNQSVERFRELAKKVPDIVPIWQSLVESSILIENYEQALAIVRDGVEFATTVENKRKIARLAMRVHLRRANAFKDMGNFDEYLQRLNHLGIAIRNDPNDRLTLRLLSGYLVDLSKATTDDNNASNKVAVDFSKADKSWLQRSVLQCEVPAVVHVLIGMRKISEGDAVTGRRHWQIARRQFPNIAVLLNNLIAVVSGSEPELMENTYDMISQAIELFPGQQTLYITRSRYFRRQGQIQDAINDVSSVYEELPNSLELLKYLVVLHEQNGDSKKAAVLKKDLEVKLRSLEPSARQRYEQSLSKIE